jgi:acetolactate decarboxylase
MREVLHEGRSEARISLPDAVAKPHAYAVGALAHLAGEITVLDGRSWVSRAADDAVTTSGPAASRADRAALLTLTHVSHWADVAITGAVPNQALEGLIEQRARERGIDPAAPFAFVIEGEFTGLRVHVIAGSCPSAASSSNGSWQKTFEGPIRGTLVGFFAKDQEGVMTHHAASTHMHVLMDFEGKPLTAHVDSVALAPGAVLRLPSTI